MGALKGKNFFYDRDETYCCGEIIEEISATHVLIKHYNMRTMSMDDVSSTISVVSVYDMSEELIEEDGFNRPRWMLFDDKAALVKYLEWLNEPSERNSDATIIPIDGSKKVH